MLNSEKTGTFPASARAALYLRKSRRDVELESAGAEDTLERHRRVLLELARQRELSVVRIYQEVVSGDTIDARPQMQQLLRDVELGLFDAVVCYDIDRLGRGGMRDQGRILDAFKWSGTLIVTPDKIYDLNADVDEEAVEFKALSARYEYRMIKKRLARGREASVREGKFIGHTAPYGYARQKLKGQKGWSLIPVEPQAETVRDIYRWYVGQGCDRIGVALIVRRLNDLGILSPGGKDWTNYAVRSILSNPEYAGYIRSHSRKQQKQMIDGVISISRPRSEPELYPGLHDALIPKEWSDEAIRLLAQNKSRPGPKQAEIKNPLAGLVICDQCGRAMVRRPYGGKRRDSLLCPYTSCGCVSSDLELIEREVVEALRRYAGELQTGAPPKGDGSGELESIDRQLRALEAQEATARSQKLRAYDLIEQGVYDVETFTARMAALEDTIAGLRRQIEDLAEERERVQTELSARSSLLPNVLHVLDVYDLTLTPKEKNDLLRSVLQKVVYHKTRRERWSGGSDLRLTLYPLI